MVYDWQPNLEKLFIVKLEKGMLGRTQGFRAHDNDGDDDVRRKPSRRDVQMLKFILMTTLRPVMDMNDIINNRSIN
jgi:hypothetical protein